MVRYNTQVLQVDGFICIPVAPGAVVWLSEDEVQSCITY
jgi:hypothetical protein